MATSKKTEEKKTRNFFELKGFLEKGLGQAEERRLMAKGVGDHVTGATAIESVRRRTPKTKVKV